MTIKVLCVGKIKEKFYREAVDEYVKRLGRYCKTEIIEVQDEKTPDNASDTVERQIREKEGQRLLDKLSNHDYVIAMAIKGTAYHSEGLAAHIAMLMNTGKSQIVFVIGGSLGLSDDVLSRADEQISFSKLTFPHQLMRVILTEQIYRSFRIINHEPYHK